MTPKNTLRNEPRPAPYKPTVAAKIKRQTKRNAVKARAHGAKAWTVQTKFSQSVAKLLKTAGKSIKEFFVEAWDYDRAAFIGVSVAIVVVLGIIGFIYHSSADSNADETNKQQTKSIQVINSNLQKLANNEKEWDKFATGSRKEIGAYFEQVTGGSHNANHFSRTDIPGMADVEHNEYFFHIIRKKQFHDVYICVQHSVKGLFNDGMTCSRWRKIDNESKITMTTATDDGPQKALNKVEWNKDLDGVFMPLNK